MSVRKLPDNKVTKDGRAYAFYINEYGLDGKRHQHQSKAYMTYEEAVQAEKDYINKYREQHNLPVIHYNNYTPKFGMDTGFSRGTEIIKPLLTLQIKRCSETSILPTKAHVTDACYDIYADLQDHSFITLLPHTSKSIRTGFCTSIPKGYFAAVFARSGLGCKKGLRLANSVGIIDADYRGEWLVVLRNDSDEEQVVSHGDRIAQFALLPVITTELVEVSELDDTDRGSGGFGSSGN